ncbi:hypothetical protein [Kineococcus terrestris]|uniref:hypothetical protein n=1 Tax=Kineococcus terrestris TaxID=2044856 RepID=UPI0034DB5AE6
MANRSPVGLGSGGRALWKSVTEAHELDSTQEVQLVEACRAKDRLDKLDDLLRGETETWVKLVVESEPGEAVEVSVQVNGALSAANSTATILKQLLAALRLPDEVSGKRPQQRGGARGAYKPTGAAAPAPGTGKVSSLDRARARMTS